MSQQTAPRPHPYVVPPYSAIISPLLDYLAPSGPAARLGFTSDLEPSAAEALSARRAELGESKYLAWIWRQRPRSGRSSPAWKPYHHGEAKPPLSCGTNSEIVAHRAIGNDGEENTIIRMRIFDKTPKTTVQNEKLGDMQNNMNKKN